MGRPVESAKGMFKVDMSHQEIERLLAELEEWYNTCNAEWITVEAAASWLQHDLGYEDQAEFEDALGGSFDHFLSYMPHVEVKTDEKSRIVFKVKPELPVTEWKPKKLTLRVKESKDLWNVCFKSPYARVEIPELEFEISADGKKHIDSVYNHICGAVFNLTNHIRGDTFGVSADHKAKIAECVEQLNKLLDLEPVWTWVLFDPSGTSTFANMDDVEVEELTDMDETEVARAALIAADRMRHFEECNVEAQGGAAAAMEAIAEEEGAQQGQQQQGGAGLEDIE